tara:strand:+ start:273 stop:569 length:297 start_codon:yes stop_codon:yes gene_type:complete
MSVNNRFLLKGRGGTFGYKGEIDMNYLKRFLQSPYTKLVIAAVLVYTGFTEAYETISEDIERGDFGAHHGIFLMGIAHGLESLTEIFSVTDEISDEKS